jgi:hypothetical protein
VTEKIVYYESKTREVKRGLIYEYRCDERLKTKIEIPNDEEEVNTREIHKKCLSCDFYYKRKVRDTESI